MNVITSRLCRKAFSPKILGPHADLFARNFLTDQKRNQPCNSTQFCHAGRHTARYLSHVPDKKEGLRDVECATKTTMSLDDVPGSKTEGEKYVIVYTCKVCDHRSAQKISKQGYHHGAVLVRCPSCQNLHLIADHLGIFEDKGWNIESFMKEQGENFNTITTDNILEFVKK